MTYKEPKPHIEGWMCPIELEWLYDQAQSMQSVVEIGCWMGKSTHAILSACTGAVYAVDHFNGSPSELHDTHRQATTTKIRPLFDRNVGMFPHLIVLEMDSVLASQRFEDRSVDMVFIDGEHTYEAFKRDLEAWMPKCRVLLCGHDRNDDGVARGLTEILKNKFTNEAGSIWSYRA
jgi:predicted O-methyltransferase YrrM